MTIVEVCAGSIEDCLIAQQEGAHRIELNSALFLGGLTPSLGTLKTVIDKGVTLPIICMVRPRGAGFCYTQEEFESMMLDAKLLLEAGASGLAFGFLKEDKTIDWNRTKQMIALCQQFHAESVFHKAFDIVPDVYEAIDPVENGDLFSFHAGPNPQCPVGRNIHVLLDDKLKAVQLDMENEMKKYTLDDLKSGMKELLAKEI